MIFKTNSWGGRGIPGEVMNIEFQKHLLNSIYIDQALVVGDRRNFISALIVPNFEALKNYLEEESVAIGSNDAIIEHKKTLMSK